MIVAREDFIIIKPVFQEKCGSIYLPKTAVWPKYFGYFYGEVVAVGPRYPYKIKPQDKILFRRHEGKEWVYGGQKYYTLKSKWVDALIREVK